MTSRGRQTAGEPYRRISVEEALAMQQEEALVIDVRSADEWATGHIKGAINIPVDDLLSRMDELPQEKDLLFVCAMGVRSGLACEMAAAMNIPTKHLYNIEEGTPRWIEKKYPTEFD